MLEYLLSKKLYDLDTKAHAKAAYPEDHFSEDGFLYIRAAAVAQGKEAYENIVKYPSRMPSEISFEPLLSLAALAYNQKTNSEFDYIAPHNSETYSNESGWR